jgi:hypothetical protein
MPTVFCNLYLYLVRSRRLQEVLQYTSSDGGGHVAALLIPSIDCPEEWPPTCPWYWPSSSA